MKIIFLPGLDGTGLLFEKLIENFSDNLDIHIIALDDIEAFTYTEQAKEIATQFANEELFLIGESYSGPIVYELCQILNEQVRGVVFLASFISRPSRLASFANFLPLSLIKPNIVTKKLLYVFGFNCVRRDDVTPVLNALTKADPRKLISRLDNLAHLSEPNGIIYCDVTYIRPSLDLLVSNRAVSLLRSKCLHYQEVVVKGGHFIAQSKPATCSQIIYNAINSAR